MTLTDIPLPRSEFVPIFILFRSLVSRLFLLVCYLGRVIMFVYARCAHRVHSLSLRHRVFMRTSNLPIVFWFSNLFVLYLLDYNNRYIIHTTISSCIIYHYLTSLVAAVLG